MKRLRQNLHMNLLMSNIYSITRHTILYNVYSVHFDVYVSVYDFFFCAFAVCKSELEGPSCTEGFV